MTQLNIPPEVRAAYDAMMAGEERVLVERLPANIDGLRLRRVMRAVTGIDFLPPRRYFDGWAMDSRQATDDRGDTRVLVNSAPFADGVEWVHASISHPDRLPHYELLKALHEAAFAGPAYQVFAPAAEHVNIHPWALHLWGRLDGARALPDFGAADHELLRGVRTI